MDIVESSGRANSLVNFDVKCAVVVLKVWTIIDIWMSLSLIGMAEEWQAELRIPVESWVTLIFGGEFGVIIMGTLGNPGGASLGSVMWWTIH